MWEPSFGETGRASFREADMRPAKPPGQLGRGSLNLQFPCQPLSESKAYVMEEESFCQKDNRPLPLKRGCVHPKDFCPYRQACIVHYLEQEKARAERKGSREDADKPCVSS
jgi:hypothetical protein